MLRLAFDFIITWRETRTRPHAYFVKLQNLSLDVNIEESLLAVSYTHLDVYKRQDTESASEQAAAKVKSCFSSIYLLLCCFSIY